jgi:hypothetical protein
MPGATPSYPPEFKREAVCLVRSSPSRSVAQEILRKAREAFAKPSSPGKTGSGERLQAHRSKEKANYSISLLCRILKVSRSGYYHWKERPPSRRARENAALMERIREILTAGALRSMPTGGSMPSSGLLECAVTASG